jgi:hypothetical protein
MVKLVRHLVRVVQATRREKAKREIRSPQWPRVEKEHLAKHPTCAACGGSKRPQVHHEKPFHTDPSLELDPNNLITLCMGKFECHIRIGHGDSFEYYNPHVVTHAARVMAHPDQREAVEAEAKLRRVRNEPGGS